MKRYLSPFFFMLISSGIVVMYILPVYQDIRVGIAKKSTLEQSIKDAATAKEKILNLGLTEASFPPDFETKLRTILPDTIDPTRLIVDVNALAERDGLRISTPAIGKVAESGKRAAPYMRQTITYSVRAPYSALRKHLRSLEHNLSLRDVTTMSFSSLVTDQDAAQYRSPELIPHTYSITLTTYSLH
jgi:hypothetical protein